MPTYEELLKQQQGGATPAPQMSPAQTSPYQQLLEQPTQMPTAGGGKSYSELLQETSPGLGTFAPGDPSAETAGHQVDIQTLAETNRATANEIASFGETPPEKEGPGLLTRIFDVLQRGNYAMAEATRRAMKDPSDIKTGTEPGQESILGGFVGGLTGKHKTTFADVLEQEGMKDGVARTVTGLALDIFADPTTYLGVGALKAAKGPSVLKAGNKAAQKAFNSDEIIKAAKEAGEKALRDSAAKPGRTLTEKGAQRVVENTRRKLAEEARQTAMSEMVKKNPGRVTLNVLGKPIAGTGAGGETLYRGVAKVGESLAKTNPGQTFKKAFRTTEKFPGELNVVKRMFEGKGVGEFDRAVKDWRRMTQYITPDEAAKISHAIEEGVDLSGVVGKHGEDLGEIQQKAKAILDDMFDIEASDEFGHLLEEGQKLDNYLYHVFRKSGKEVDEFKNLRKKVAGTQQPGFDKPRHLPTLKDALEKDLDPITDVREIVARRLEKHWKTRSRYGFERELAENYGLIVPKKAKKVVKGKKTKTVWEVADPDEAKRIKDLAKEMGYKEVKSPLQKNAKIYVPEEVAKVWDHTLEVFGSDEAANEIMRFFDKSQNIWKTAATVVNPGHHFRNAIGDMWLNYLDGVVDPTVYRQAWKIVRDKDSVLRIGGRELSGNDIENLYIKHGLKSGFTRAEFGKHGKIGGVMGRNVERIRQFSEGREDFARYAHFIDALKKEMPKKVGKGKFHVAMDEAAANAAKRVRKWNIDYGDFTEFEQNKMKRLIPFYSFMRKNLPLQLEAIAMRPGRVAALPKGMQAIESLLGTNRKEAHVEETIPRWLKELSGIQITGGEEPFFLSGGLPIQDIATWDATEGGTGAVNKTGLTNVLRNLLSTTSPALQAPFEIGTGTELFTGAPMKEGALQYSTGLIPMGRVVGEMLSDKPGTEKVTKAINYLLNPGLQQATYGRRKGELRRQQDIVQGVLNELRKQQEEQVYGPNR